MRRSHRKQAWVMGAMLLLLGCRVDAEAPPASRARQWFEEGRQLIEVNCGVCDQRSREGLEEGVRLVVAAVDGGYPDPAAAHRLLADAYGTLAWVDSEPDSEEQTRYAAAQVEALAAVAAASPQSPAALVDYALALPDGPQQESLLRQALELEPSTVRAMFYLGRLEVLDGAEEAGLERMRAAFDRAEGVEKVELGRRLSVFLREIGREQAAAELSRELEEVELEVLSEPQEPEEDARR